MTAKEKALSLFHAHAKQWHVSQEETIKDAIITIDEALNCLSKLPQDDLKVKWETMLWQSVKSEIEELK